MFHYSIPARMNIPTTSAAVKSAGSRLQEGSKRACTVLLKHLGVPVDDSTIQFEGSDNIIYPTQFRLSEASAGAHGAIGCVIRELGKFGGV